MGNPVPAVRDRIGGRDYSTAAMSAVGIGVTPIPANESIVLINWYRGHERTTLHADGGLRMYGAADALLTQGIGGHETEMGAMIFKVWATSQYAPYSFEADACMATVLNRDDGLWWTFLDGVLTDTGALTRDPDLATSLDLEFGNVLNEWEATYWRGAILSIAPGACPDVTGMGAMLSTMVDPQAPFSPGLRALKGTRYSDYSPGEGVYDLNHIVDNGDSGDDLTWQLGAKVNDYRVAASTPTRPVIRTWYGVQPGGTAITDWAGGGHDYGGGAAPIVLRAFVKATHRIGGAGGFLYVSKIGGGSIGFDVATHHGLTVSPVPPGVAGYVHMVGMNGYSRHLASIQSHSTDLLDVVYVQYGYASGSVTQLVVNGNVIHEAHIDGDFSMAGNLYVYMDGRQGLCPRVTLWQPATMPTDILSRLRSCVMDIEHDPDLGTPILDYPLHDGILTAAGTTDIPNQGSGGDTLTLASGRDTDCRVILAP